MDTILTYLLYRKRNKCKVVILNVFVNGEELLNVDLCP